MTKKINNSIQSCNVLVTPLDWGLGHATRCIPIIKCLQESGFNVYVATEGKNRILLEIELSGVNFIELHGYNIVYSKGKNNFRLKLFSQLPKILRAVKQENKWLNQIIQKYAIKIVISDNRFGLHNTNVYSIFITHQLHIETGSIFFNRIAQKINYAYIEKFNECWVPDFAKEPSLAGKLSHPQKNPSIPIKYIGPQSRLKQIETAKLYDLVIMLSGPEPQRTNLEKLFLDEILPGTIKKILFIRGMPESLQTLPNRENIIFYNHVKSEILSEILCAAKMVVCRGGYSTVMDLVALQVNALLIATPGQTEQEYLALHLNKTGYFQYILQDAEVIKMALDNSLQKTQFPLTNNYLLKKAVEELPRIAG